MVTYRKLRINISEIRQNGVLCANPIVAWITQEGIFYPCIGEDYIEIEVPITADPKVELVVQCDDCSVCPPIHIDRDLCTTSTDCADCEECVGGFCVPLCPTTLCIDDTCVDCIDDDDCPDNLICSGGKCVCPPNMPFQNAKGECVGCLTDSNCPKCTYCLGGECVPLECGDGVCDPDTGECEECINNGNCGTNECCVDNDCVCCEGFHWDYDLNLCVPDPECWTNDDCRVCEGCVGNQCVEIPLQEGYMAIEEDGECIIVKICTCGSDECPQGYTCITYDGSTCICVQCEGTCVDNDDCGEGCFCGGNSICLPSPCHGSCENGADCGEGCGCLNGECVPCSSIDCATNPTACAEIIGCECAGNTCTKIGSECTGGCQNVFDCGEGCTCYNNECVPCGYFNCDNADCDSRDGCQCDGQSNCVDNPGDRECDAELLLTKDDANCDLTATLDNAVNCACPAITTAFKLVSANSTNTLVNFQLTLHKGIAAFPAAVYLLPRLGDYTNPNIAENEVPSNGSYELTIKGYYEPYPLGGAGQLLPISVTPISVAGAGLVNVNNIALPQLGSIVGGTKLKYIELTLTLKTNLIIPNGCTYLATHQIGKFTYTETNSITNLTNSPIYGEVTSTDSMYPLFTWYKSDINTFSASDIFRKLYIPEIANAYTDTLYGFNEAPTGKYPLEDIYHEGELWSNRYYHVTADCSCANAATSPKIFFCNPSNITYTLSECNTQIVVDDFTPCDVNQDISQSNDSIPSNVQVKYDMYLNGSQTPTATFVHVVNLGMVDDDTNLPILQNTYDIGASITSITFKIQGSDECIWSYTEDALEDRVLTYTVDCVDGLYYNVTIPIANNPFPYTLGTSTVEITKNAPIITTPYNPSWSVVGGDIVVVVPKGQDVSIKVYYTDDCSKTIRVKESCCEYTQGDALLTITGAQGGDPNCGGTLTLTADIAPTLGLAPFTYLFSVPKSGGGYNTYTTTSNNRTASTQFTSGNYTNGTATVTITDELGCEFTAEAPINVVVYTLVYEEDYYACYGQSVDVAFSVSPIPPTPSFVQFNGTPVPLTNGAATVTVAGLPVGNTTYSYTSMSLDGCIVQLAGKASVVHIISTPTLTIIPTADSGIFCYGNDPRFVVSGTLGAVATFSMTVDGIPVTPTPTTHTFTALQPTVTIPINLSGETILTANVSLTSGETTCTGGTYTSTVEVTENPTLTISSYSCDGDLAEYTVRVNTNADIVTSDLGTPTQINASTWDIEGIPTTDTATITAVNVATPLCTTIVAAYKDCGCTDLDDPVEDPIIATDTFYYCFDDPADQTITAAAAAGHTLTWYDSLIGSSVGTGASLVIPREDLIYTTHTYYVESTQTASGCTSEKFPIYVVSEAVPEATINPPATICALQTVTFTSTVLYWGFFPTYLWSITGDAAIDGDADESTVDVVVGTDGQQFELTLTFSNETPNGGIICDTEETYSGTAVDCCIEDECITQYFSMDASGGDLELTGFTDNNGNLCAGFNGEVFTDNSQAGNDAVITAIETNLPLCCPNLDWNNFEASVIYQDSDNRTILILTGSPVTYASLATTGNNGAETWAAVTTACDAGTCIWNITAEQTEEGCYSITDGDDFNIDVDYESGVCGGSHILTFQCYVNGEAVRTYQTTGTCATGTFSINASNILGGVDMTTILTAADNELSVIASCNSVARYAATVLTFPANDCTP